MKFLPRIWVFCFFATPLGARDRLLCIHPKCNRGPVWVDEDIVFVAPARLALAARQCSDSKLSGRIGSNARSLC